MRRLPLLLCLVALPDAAFGQAIATSGGPETTVELFEVGDHALSVSITVAGEDPRELSLETRMRGGATLVAAEWLPVDLPVLRLQIEASEGDRSLVTALLVDGRDSRVLVTGRGDVDRDYVIAARDLDDDGANELVAESAYAAAGVCGHPGVGLEPMAYDADEGRFRPIGVRFDFTLAGPPISASGTAPAPLFDATPLRVVSSDESAAIPETWQPSPAALADDDATTLWRDAAPGDGRGQFVTGDVLDGAMLAGIVLTTTSAAPRRWLLTTEAGDYALAADAAGELGFVLPAPVESRCFTLVALDTGDDGAFELAEARGFTNLDLLGADEVFDDVLAPYFAEPDLIATLGPLVQSARFDVVPRLAEQLDLAPSRAHTAAIVELLLALDGGAPVLFDRLASDAEDADVAANLARSLARHGEHLDGLVEVALARGPGSGAALAALAQLEPLDAAADFAHIAGTGESIEREFIVALIAGAPTTELDAVLDGYVDRDEAARIDLMRAAVRIVDRDAMAPTGACATLAAASHSTQGTEARLALTAGVRGACANVFDYAAQVLAGDPEPMMRATAAAALAATEAGRPLVVAALLSDTSPDVRLEAARGLRDQLVSIELVDDIALAMGQETWTEVRRHIARVLVNQQTAEADHAVFAAMAASDDSELRTLLRVFSTRTAPVDASAILVALDSRQRESESLAIASALLARADGPAASERLAAWCLEGDAVLAPSACESAARRGDALVRNHLEQLARGGAVDERLWALRAISAYGDEESRAFMSAMFETETDADVRAALERLLRFATETEAIQDIRNDLVAPTPLDLEL